MTWVEVEDVEEPRCGAKRGPRGTVTCEKPAHHVVLNPFSLLYECGEEHAGRGKSGQWFFWE